MSKVNSEGVPARVDSPDDVVLRILRVKVRPRSRFADVRREGAS